MKFPLCQHAFFPKNKKGRDWFCGDVHGDLMNFLGLLSSRGFSWCNDRVFLCGDTIDRGEDSAKVLGVLLSQSGFAFSCLGNHELMFYESMWDVDERRRHIRNGGNWVNGESEERLDRLRGVVAEKMPLAITVETEYGLIGLSHASAPDDWHVFEHEELTYADCYRFLSDSSQCSDAACGKSAQIKNVGLSLHGHTNSNEIVVGRNQAWIDTKYIGGGETLLTAHEAFSLISR